MSNIYFQGGTIMLMPEDRKVVESFCIDLHTLQDATSKFDLDNKVGEGCFATVYKVHLFNIAT
jgi:hypothetical protein